jgi:hypothetical protein
MGNAFQSISSGIAELKNFYEGPLKDQFNEDCPIYRGSEKTKKGWSGQQVIRPLRVRRNQGIGATSDGGILPAIGRQTTQQAQISAVYNYLRFGVTGPMIKASQSDKGSFVRSASYELEMGYKDLTSDVNRQLGYDGTGKLASMASAAVATTSLSISGRESVEAAIKFLDVGAVIDITDGTTIKASGITINAMTFTNPDSLTATLTVSAPVTCLSTDYIIRSGSLGNEIQGLLYALDGGTTTIYNVNRSTYPQFQGNVTDNSVVQLKLDDLAKLWNVGKRRGGAKYRAINSDYDSQRMYQKLLTADKRYMNTVKGDGGFSNKDENYLEYNGIPWVADKDFAQRIAFLPDDTFIQYILAEMEFADETGSMMIAQTSADAFEVRVRLFTNMFNEAPAACGVLKNYTSP